MNKEKIEISVLAQQQTLIIKLKKAILNEINEYNSLLNITGHLFLLSIVLGSIIFLLVMF